MPRKLTKEDFIIKAKEIHGDKYDYSLTNYKGILQNIKIICPNHHIFEQKPDHHLYRKQGCASCLPNKKINQQEFLDRMDIIFGDTLLFTRSQYVNNSTGIIVTCPIHGEFSKIPSYLFNGDGCAKCRFDIRKANGETVRAPEVFFKNVKLRSPNLSFNNSVFKGHNDPIIVTCQKHGEFIVNEARNLLRHEQCELCSQESKINHFINRSKEIHGDRYDYSKINSYYSKHKLTIICKKHGEFLMKPGSHLNGKGCSKCSKSRGETYIELFLSRSGVRFVQEMIFLDCKDKKPLRFDFYLPDYNTCIEFDGYWHFNPHPSDPSQFDKVLRRDRIKNIYCRENHINLIRIKDLRDVTSVLVYLKL